MRPVEGEGHRKWERIVYDGDTIVEQRPATTNEIWRMTCGTL